MHLSAYRILDTEGLSAYRILDTEGLSAYRILDTECEQVMGSGANGLWGSPNQRPLVTE